MAYCRCQKEAAWAITNLCMGGTPAQLEALVSVGFIEPYCALLNSPDNRAIVVVLEGLTNLLQVNSEKIHSLVLYCDALHTEDKLFFKIHEHFFNFEVLFTNHLQP